MSDTKNIVKNSFLLYIRLFIIIVIVLYTSRIVLNTLGIEDFGLFNVIAATVALFGFINIAISSATNRFLSFYVEKDIEEHFRKMFSSIIVIQLGVVLIIFLFAETIGLWYVNNYLNIPAERMSVVNWVYQFSVLSFLAASMQAPYMTLLIVRERMKAFTVISVADAVLKLLIVYLLLITSYDKLILYSFLVFLASVLILIIYVIYCRKNFKEGKFKLYKEKDCYMELISYTGWSLFGSAASAGRNHGVNLILNAFFGLVVNAAYGITMQIYGVLTTFLGSFSSVVNPQIVKKYSQGNLTEAFGLIFKSAKFSFFLMLLIINPIILNTQYILNLWLINPPPLTAVFVRLSLIAFLVQATYIFLATGINATGKIKWFKIIEGALVFLNVPVSYILLKYFGSAEYAFYVNIVLSVFGLTYTLFYSKKVMNLNIRNYTVEVLLKIFAVWGASTAILFYVSEYFQTRDFVDFCLTTLCITIANIILIVFLGMTKGEMKMLKSFFLKK